MKILLVNKFHYKKGGSETYYFTLANTLVSLGHEVIFFAMEDDKNFNCDQSKYFVSNVGVSSGIKGKLKMIKNIAYSKEAYKKMQQLLDDEKPDVAILNLIHKQITCSIIDSLIKHNVKVVWTMHDLITVCPAYTMLDGNGKICEKCLEGDFNNCKNNKCIHGSTLMSYLSTYEAKVIKKKGWYNKVDLFVCPSKFYKEKLREGHFTNSPIIHMPNPLPLDTDYGVNINSEDYILYFGRLSKEKGVRTLIESMKYVEGKLIILGTGPIEEELHKFITDENLQDKVSMLGFKTGEELELYIKNAICVVLPSEWYENGPYSAMEAMALGKPLIVSNNGGLPELVDNEKNGYIYGSKEELINQLNKMFNIDKKTYELLCENSYNKAKLCFDPIIYCEKLLKEIEV